MALAKQYMLKAKAQGVPVSADGKYNGGEKLLTIATNAAPGDRTAEVAQAQFEKLGFKLNFRKVPQDTLYTRYCNVPKQKIAICPNVGWFKDFVDPQSMLQTTFSGDEIKQQNNSNWTELNDPAINKAMTDAATIPAGPERNQAWAKIDNMIIGQAPAVPYVWDKSAEVFSKDVKHVMNGYYTTADLSFVSLK
jgi:peptide/nickel transport system substrate-binding protein